MTGPSGPRRAGPAEEEELRRTVVAVARLLQGRGLTAATDGNISCRLSPGELLFTPTGLSKGRVREEDLVVTDLSGAVLRGSRRPSAEFRMHLAIYEERDDVGAVVHAHPPTATAMTIAGVSWLMERPVIPEVVAVFGAIPTLPYATPTSEEVPGDVRRAVRKHVGLLLDRHGAVTVGPDLWTAYDRMEKLEHSARILSLAHRLGEVRELTPEQVARLRPFGDSAPRKS